MAIRVNDSAITMAMLSLIMLVTPLVLHFLSDDKVDGSDVVKYCGLLTVMFIGVLLMKIDQPPQTLVNKTFYVEAAKKLSDQSAISIYFVVLAHAAGELVKRRYLSALREGRIGKTVLRVDVSSMTVTRESPLFGQVYFFSLFLCAASSFIAWITYPSYARYLPETAVLSSLQMDIFPSGPMIVGLLFVSFAGYMYYAYIVAWVQEHKRLNAYFILPFFAVRPMLFWMIALIVAGALCLECTCNSGDICAVQTIFGTASLKTDVRPNNGVGFWLGVWLTLLAFVLYVIMCSRKPQRILAK